LIKPPQSSNIFSNISYFEDKSELQDLKKTINFLKKDLGSPKETVDDNSWEYIYNLFLNETIKRSDNIE